MSINEKIPDNKSKRKAEKLAVPKTRGKNQAGQTNGQWEQDTRVRAGGFEGAGQAPRMQK
jgi:hypothetical protein